MDTEVTLTVRVDGPGGALVPERTLEFQLTTGVRGLPKIGLAERSFRP